MIDIDYSRLSRDYEKYPLEKGYSSRYGSKKGEIPALQDINYLYIDLNMNLSELANFFNRGRDTARIWLKYYDISKPVDLQISSAQNTKSIKYGDKNYNNITKSLDTKMKIYGKMGNGDGTRAFFQNATPEEKDLVINKRKSTCLKKYGVDNPMKSDKILSSFLQNISFKPTKPELSIKKLFDGNNIEYIFQYRIYYLGLVKFYDFYLPKFNLLIEYDGDFWHKLESQKANDLLKNKIALELGYNLVRIKGHKMIDSYWEIVKE